MLDVPVLQIGVGGVGRALVEQVLDFNARLSGSYDFRFVYIGIADRRGAIVGDDHIPTSMLLKAAKVKRDGGTLLDLPEAGPLNDWQNLLTPLPCIIVDVTAQDRTEMGLMAAIEQGHRVVLANKKPLCASMELFCALTERGQTRYEATVGAGLPIIATLQSLVGTGDAIRRLEGCFSGTLGAITTQLQDNVPFSQAVAYAMQRGWTEPDPRDDLSGMDVARKALILARTSGFKAELSDVLVESLYPASLADMPLDQFMPQLPLLDDHFQKYCATATQKGKTLRYLARVDGAELKVGLEMVALDGPLGSLRGTDNLVAFYTQRYAEQPLSIRGPGAGADVTASGLLSDMIAFGREWD